MYMLAFFISEYKVNLVDLIRKKLNTKSANFHIGLLNVNLKVCNTIHLVKHLNFFAFV